jgi:hypothetical protein
MNLFLFFLVSSVNAAALTTALSANERLCFYADVDKAGEKLGVCLILSSSESTTYVFSSSILLYALSFFMQHQ